MNWQTMFTGSEYLSAAEFGDRLFTAEISEVRPCKVEDEHGREKGKAVVFFKGHERGWMLCKTNAMCVAGMFGDDVRGWSGKRVTLFATMVSVGKEKQPGIRVKGSPDLTKPVSVEIKLPRKKPFRMTLQPTGKGAQQQAAPAPAPEPEPEPIVDTETGETF